MRRSQGCCYARVFGLGRPSNPLNPPAPFSDAFPVSLQNKFRAQAERAGPLGQRPEDGRP